MSIKDNKRQSDPEWLITLDREAVEKQPIPLKYLLSQSCYYPCCCFDGRPVQFLAGWIHSFIYADYGVNEDELDTEITRNGFRGYEVLVQRDLNQADLTPRGWNPVFRPHWDKEEYTRRVSWWAKPPFGKWYIFQRKDGFGDGHGPERFSWIYLCAEACATYQALYLSRGIAPHVLCLIQPGDGFGGGWAPMTNEKGPLAETVFGMFDEFASIDRKTQPVPEYMVCGGMGTDYAQSFWPSYYPTIIEHFQIANGNGIWKLADPYPSFPPLNHSN